MNLREIQHKLYETIAELHLRVSAFDNFRDIFESLHEISHELSDLSLPVVWTEMDAPKIFHQVKLVSNSQSPSNIRRLIAEQMSYSLAQGSRYSGVLSSSIAIREYPEEDDTFASAFIGRVAVWEPTRETKHE